MQTMILYNPAAGKMRRGAGRLLKGAVEALDRQEIRAGVKPTPMAGTAGALARDLATTAGVNRILVAGGDGTMNEVVNGIAELNVEVGILPAGTGNVLANELGIGKWQQALDTLSTWIPRRVPVGVLSFPDGTSRKFLMMAGAGLDARLVYAVNPSLKRHVGKLAYWLAGLSQLSRKLEQMRVVADGHDLQSSFCLASRVRNYGGDLSIAPSIRLPENDLEIVCFEGKMAADYLPHLAAVLTGRVATAEGISVFRCRELELFPSTEKPVHVQVDGEHAGYLPACVKVVPDAITLLLPPAYLKKTQEQAV
jgi:diacylglycerol kinase (ATP)